MKYFRACVGSFLVYICILGKSCVLLSSVDFFFKIIFFLNFRNFNTITVSNSLDPDQVRHLVEADLVPNSLQYLSPDHTSPDGMVLSFFSSYIGLGPASTGYPKKYRKFQAIQKVFEILATQKISCILYPGLKYPKMHRNVPKYDPIS